MKKIIFLLTIAITSCNLVGQTCTKWKQVSSQPVFSEDFSTKTNWYSATNFAIQDGVVKLNSSTTLFITADYSVTNITAGEDYTVSLNVIKNTGGIKIFMGAEYREIPSGETGYISVNMTANNTSSQFAIYRISDTNLDIEFDDLLITQEEATIDVNSINSSGQLELNGVTKVFQNLTALNNVNCTINLDVVNNTGTGFYITLGGTTQLITATGAISLDLVAGSLDTKIVFKSTNPINLVTIDNVQIIPVLGNSVSVANAIFDSLDKWKQQLTFSEDFSTKSQWDITTHAAIQNEAVKFNTGGALYISTDFTSTNIDAGEDYTVSLNISKNIGDGLILFMGGTRYDIAGSVTGNINFSIKAGSSNTSFQIYRNSSALNFDIEFDDLSITHEGNTVVESVNTLDQLELNGVTKVFQELTAITTTNYILSLDVIKNIGTGFYLSLGGGTPQLITATGAQSVTVTGSDTDTKVLFESTDASNLITVDNLQITTNNGGAIDVVNATFENPKKWIQHQFFTDDFSTKNKWASTYHSTIINEVVKLNPTTRINLGTDYTTAKLTAGENYTVHIKVIKNTGGIRVYMGGTIKDIASGVIGDLSYSLTAGNTDTTFEIARIPGTSFDLEFDDLSIQIDGAAKANFNAVNSMGQLELNGGTHVFQELSGISNNSTYTVGLDVINNTGAGFYVSLGGGTPELITATGAASVTVLAGNLDDKFLFESNDPSNLVTIDNLQINPNIVTVSIESGDFNCASLNTEKLESISEIKVFPNPAKNYLIITSKENANYSILSVIGKKQANGSLKGGNNTINIYGLEKGIYLLNITTAKGSKTFKVVKE